MERLWNGLFLKSQQWRQGLRELRSHSSPTFSSSLGNCLDLCLQGLWSLQLWVEPVQASCTSGLEQGQRTPFSEGFSPFDVQVYTPNLPFSHTHTLCFGFLLFPFFSSSSALCHLFEVDSVLVNKEVQGHSQRSLVLSTLKQSLSCLVHFKGHTVPTTCTHSFSIIYKISFKDSKGFYFWIRKLYNEPTLSCHPI